MGVTKKPKLNPDAATQDSMVGPHVQAAKARVAAKKEADAAAERRRTGKQTFEEKVANAVDVLRGLDPDVLDAAYQQLQDEEEQKETSPDSESGAGAY